MADIPEKVKEICKEIGLSTKDACWQLPQNRAWVMKHKALEKIAAYKGVKFDLPNIIESSAEKKMCVILVSGTIGDVSEWSIGEATTYNNKNGYPYAMAEKRAKDRVILKLVGLHGDVYSDIEADFEKELNNDQNNGQTPTKPKQDQTSEEVIPMGVRKFGGKKLSELDIDGLEELEKVVTTNKWRSKIAEAKKSIPKKITKSAAQVYETSTEADTAWLNLS